MAFEEFDKGHSKNHQDRLSNFSRTGNQSKKPPPKFVMFVSLSSGDTAFQLLRKLRSPFSTTKSRPRTFLEARLLPKSLADKGDR